MGRRRKKDNTFELVKAVMGLVLLGVFALAGFDLKKAASLLTLVVLAVVVIFVALGVIVGVAAILRRVFAKPYAPVYRYQAVVPSACPPTSSSTPESSFAQAPIAAPRPERFTPALLDKLEWRRFETLVEALFRAEGLYPSRIRAGADGGIDLALRRTSDGPVFGIVQCKAWKAYPVGVKPVRELFGVMHAEGVAEGHFVTSGRFTSEALAFAGDKALHLIDGDRLLERLNSLPLTDRVEVLENVTAGDYQTPTCPSCDIKMVQRRGARGPFWGCASFPRCRQTFPLRSVD